MHRGIRRLALASSATLALAGLAAAPALAASATTLPATSVLTTSAKLNGTFTPDGQPATWQFQWGLTTNYNKATPLQTVAAGQTGAVPASWTLTNLTPNTTYHFRLAVITGNGTPYSPIQKLFGQDVTFTTKPTGRLSLLSNLLTVRGGKVFAPLACASRLPCDGNFSITTQVKLAKTHKFGPIDCTKASTTFYKIAAGKRTTVSAGVTPACLALLRAARSHRLSAKFTSTPRTGQLGVIRQVTLILR